ncbi:hypothetical protein MFIFM68171_06633 [Madurella fahalii]|uniref:Rhodopsin domain-containing protein n=1 Tax=Madurella fahalii TaxID=1157608 RepID=A0ABQ0GF83_9PEZI
MAPTGDSDGDSGHQASIVACAVVMLVLATATVTTRLYTRHAILGSLGPDDWLIVVALFFSVGATIGSVRRGSCHWGLARICNNTVMAVVVACNIWVVVASFIACVPLTAVWDKSVEGFCLPLEIKASNGYLHIATDFIIFLLPIPVVVKLKLPRRQKIGLMLVFAVAFVACLISVIRIVSISSLNFADLTYELTTLVKWGSVEVNLAIICACLTILKPLVVKLFPRLLRSYGTFGPASFPNQMSTGISAGRRDGMGRTRPENGSWTNVKPESRPRISSQSSEDGERRDVEDLEDQIQRGVYVDGISVSLPPKAYTRLS